MYSNLLKDGTVLNIIFHCFPFAQINTMGMLRSHGLLQVEPLETETCDTGDAGDAGDAGHVRFRALGAMVETFERYSARWTTVVEPTVEHCGLWKIIKFSRVDHEIIALNGLCGYVLMIFMHP